MLYANGSNYRSLVSFFPEVTLFTLLIAFHLAFEKLPSLEEKFTDKPINKTKRKYDEKKI